MDTSWEFPRLTGIPAGNREAGFCGMAVTAFQVGRRPFSCSSRHGWSVWLNPLLLEPNKEEHFFEI